MNPHEPAPPSVTAAKSPPAPAPIEDAGVTDPAVAPNKLTPEEQMALFEKDLKETDWGHQPC